MKGGTETTASQIGRGEPTFYLLTVVAIALFTVAGASTSPPPHSHLIDHSYQHYLGQDAIAKSVGDEMLHLVGGDEDRDDMMVEVDVSASLLGDEGMSKLIDALDQTKGDKCGSVCVKLSARMNKMTSAGASALFESIQKMGRPTEGQISLTGTDASVSNSAKGDEGEEQGNVTAAEPGSAGDSTSRIDQPSSSSSTDDIVTSADDAVTSASSAAAAKPLSLPRYPYVKVLDIGLNDLSSHHRASSSRAFAKSLRMLIEGPVEDQGCGSCCPSVIRLDRCGLGPATCRAIGKGIINVAGVESKIDEENDTRSVHRRRLSALHLSGNDAIGDAGAAALAAALRTAPRRRIKNDESLGKECLPPILNTLDLSSCGIGDAGAEALAMAIKDNPGCVKNLDLSNNRISDEGATSIGRALQSSRIVRVKKTSAGHEGGKERRSAVVMESIDLSSNQEIGDKGASALAGGLECGALHILSIRSCLVRADGALAFGKALCTVASSIASKGGKETDDVICKIDLSGNQLGTLQAKKKKGAQYSASLLKSKASATTASYMNFIGRKIQSGLKDAGMGNFVSSVESDDDEEELMGDTKGTEENGGRCGARSFSDAIVNDSADVGIGVKDSNAPATKCTISMRNCFLDEGAADALAGAIIRAKEKFNLEISIDTRMNEALDENVVSALNGHRAEGDLLQTMARRHFTALEALRIARLRAAETAAAAAARARAEMAFDNALGEEEYSDFGGFPEAGVDGYDDDPYGLAYDEDDY